MDFITEILSLVPPQNPPTRAVTNPQYVVVNFTINPGLFSSNYQVSHTINLPSYDQCLVINSDYSPSSIWGAPEVVDITFENYDQYTFLQFYTEPLPAGTVKLGPGGEYPSYCPPSNSRKPDNGAYFLSAQWWMESATVGQKAQWIRPGYYYKLTEADSFIPIVDEEYRTKWLSDKFEVLNQRERLMDWEFGEESVVDGVYLNANPKVEEVVEGDAWFNLEKELERLIEADKARIGNSGSFFSRSTYGEEEEEEEEGEEEGDLVVDWLQHVLKEETVNEEEVELLSSDFSYENEMEEEPGVVEEVQEVFPTINEEAEIVQGKEEVQGVIPSINTGEDSEGDVNEEEAWLFDSDLSYESEEEEEIGAPSAEAPPAQGLEPGIGGEKYGRPRAAAFVQKPVGLGKSRSRPRPNEGQILDDSILLGLN